MDQSSSSSHLSFVAQHDSLEWSRRDSSRLEDYEVLRLLGRGAYGSVHLVRNKVDGVLYALKRVKGGASALREVQVLSSLQHDNVVRYYGAWIESGSDIVQGEESSEWTYASSVEGTEPEDPVCNLCNSSYSDWEVSFEHWGLIDSVLQPLNLCVDCYKKSIPSDNNVDLTQIHIRERERLQEYLYILMEYCEHTLMDQVSNNDLDKWDLFSQCVPGLDYLHQRNILHRDCKPSNIFVRNGIVKIGDMGLAATIHNLPSSLEEHEQQDAELSCDIGTFLYAAPEVASGRYDAKCDVYSLGVVLVELFCTFTTAMERATVLRRLPEELPDNMVDGAAAAATAATSLARRMLAVNPMDRPSCRQIMHELSETMAETRVSQLERQLATSEETIRLLKKLLDEHDIDYSHIATD